jgi:hypothetical protein
MAADRKPRTLTDGDIQTRWTRTLAADFTVVPHADRMDMAWRDGGPTADHVNVTDNDYGDGRDYNLFALRIKAR